MVRLVHVQLLAQEQDRALAGACSFKKKLIKSGCRRVFVRLLASTFFPALTSGRQAEQLFREFAQRGLKPATCPKIETICTKLTKLCTDMYSNCLCRFCAIWRWKKGRHLASDSDGSRWPHAQWWYLWVGC